MFKEYRSPEMGSAIKAMWDFKRNCDKKGKSDKKKKEALIEEYCKQYKKQKKYDSKSLHNQRRQVSLYFQQIASLAARDKEIKKSIIEIWNKQYLKIIPEILEPIEMIALPKCVDGKIHENKDEYPQFMKDMLALYNFPEPKFQKKLIN